MIELTVGDELLVEDLKDMFLNVSHVMLNCGTTTRLYVRKTDDTYIKLIFFNREEDILPIVLINIFEKVCIDEISKYIYNGARIIEDIKSGKRILSTDSYYGQSVFDNLSPSVLNFINKIKIEVE